MCESRHKIRASDPYMNFERVMKNHGVMGNAVEWSVGVMVRNHETFPIFQHSVR